MIIDNRSDKPTAIVKKVIRHASGDCVYVDIFGMNHTHAIAEIESEGGRILSISQNAVGGYIPGEISEKTKTLLENGWEWKT
jgi:hypothetical protein